MSKRKGTTNVSSAQSAKKCHWAFGLLESMKDPALKVREDGHVVVIKDKFPKAEYHYLILPKKEIPSLVNLVKEDEELLRHMEQVGKQLTKLHVHREFNIWHAYMPDFLMSCEATTCQCDTLLKAFFSYSKVPAYLKKKSSTNEQASKNSFCCCYKHCLLCQILFRVMPKLCPVCSRIGYHASPNMHQLHLHVISTDFNSPCLKTKVHWNSFTSPFFKTSEEIRQEMCNNGKIAKMKCEECDEYLKQPLKCHKCSFTPKNMPELKKHILSHIHERPK